jgi:hypothetical protein
MFKVIELSQIHEMGLSHESCLIRELDGTPAQDSLTLNLKHATPGFIGPRMHLKSVS